MATPKPYRFTYRHTTVSNVWASSWYAAREKAARGLASHLGEPVDAMSLQGGVDEEPDGFGPGPGATSGTVVGEWSDEAFEKISAHWVKEHSRRCERLWRSK